MENFSRCNSGTLKLSTRVDHPSAITCHDSKVKTSKVNVTIWGNVIEEKG